MILLVSSLSCNFEEEDKTLSIYHLKPNHIGEFPEYKTNKKNHSLGRNDFFAIKNFDATNETYKIKVDSFVINYIKNDSFLINNKNAIWSLIFFKYGDGITENTKHQFGTDYAIHNLFAFKKRLIYYTFNSRYKKPFEDTGYYFNKGDSIVDENRKLIEGYFKNKDIPYLIGK